MLAEIISISTIFVNAAPAYITVRNRQESAILFLLQIIFYPFYDGTDDLHSLFI